MTRWTIRARATVERRYAVEAETKEQAIKMIEENQPIKCMNEDDTWEDFDWGSLRKDGAP